MPRLPRFELAGRPRHVIQRDSNREPVFAHEDDYAVYLGALTDACARFGCAVHAYVLMTNHVHLPMCTCPSRPRAIPASAG